MKKDDKKYSLEDVWQLFAQTDLQFKETDRQFKETVLQFKETDRKIKETDELVRKLTKSTTLHEQYIDNQSAKVEHFFIEAIRKNGCRIGDIEFDEIQPNTMRVNKQDGVELDGLLFNGKYVGILEVKSTLHQHDIQRILKKIPRFRSHFKEYANKELLIYVAGEIVHDDAVKVAHELGFIVLTPDGQKINVDQTKVHYY